MSHIKDLMQFLSKNMQVHLMGIDIVRNAETGICYIIDLNYWSSYNDSFKDLKKFELS